MKKKKKLFKTLSLNSSDFDSLQLDLVGSFPDDRPYLNLSLNKRYFTTLSMRQLEALNKRIKYILDGNKKGNKVKKA
jgi:hypothetical protein